MNQSIHINDIRHVDFIHNKHWFVYLIPFLRHQGQKKKKKQTEKNNEWEFSGLQRIRKTVPVVIKEALP